MNLILVAIAVTIILIGCVYIKFKKRLKDPVRKRKRYHNTFVFLRRNLLTRKRFRRVEVSFASMMCFEYEELQQKCVKVFLKSVGASIMTPLFIFIVTKEIVLTVVAVLIAYIYYNIMVDRAIDKQEIDIDSALSMTIASIRDNYALTDNIPKSVISCERETCLERPINKIFEILTDEEGEDLLMEFKRSTPNRLLSTLATTCFLTNDEGDVRDADGASAFGNELIVLRQEADARIRQLVKTDIAFKSLGNLTLVGLIVMPLIEMFLLSQMPGTALFLKGIYGSVVKVIITLTVAFTYYIISVLRRPSVVNQVDKIEFVNNLSRKNEVKELVKKLIPKKFKTRHRLNKLLNNSLSSKNFEYIYTLKPVMAVTVFALSIVAFIIFVISARAHLYYNYNSLMLTSSGEMTEKRLEEVKVMDAEYLALDEPLFDEDLSMFVKAHISGIENLDVETQADRLSKKYEAYHKIKFQWYYIVLSYIFAIAAWFSPEISLVLRKYLVKFEAAEDIMQLQTLMITLSNTKMDVYKALRWLTLESTVHKAPLMYAYLEYPSDPELSLEKLKDSITERDMKRLVSKLIKAIYDLSLSEAFSDITLDKQQSMALQGMLQDEVLESKKYYAKMLAIIPIGMVLILDFVAPILLLGINQLSTAFSTLAV